MARPPEPETDHQLLTSAASGDARAQEAIVSRLSPRVLRLSRMLTGNSADADDAAQRALLEILKSAASFRGESSLNAWVDRITVRTTTRLLRKEAQRRTLLQRWFAPGALPFARTTPTAPPEMHGLQPLLQRLTPPRREALLLRHVLGYSVEEIGALTHTPVGTVKDRLVQARKQMRDWLERNPGWSPPSQAPSTTTGAEQ